jgi:hypothetical protein
VTDDARVDELCSKCGERPRSGKQRWCARCINISRKPKAADVSERVRKSPTTEDVPPPPRIQGHAECQRQINSLTEEVAHLKGELASRPQTSEEKPKELDALLETLKPGADEASSLGVAERRAQRAGKTVGEVLVDDRARLRRSRATPRTKPGAKPDPEVSPPASQHGPNCQCVFHRNRGPA